MPLNPSKLVKIGKAPKQLKKVGSVPKNISVQERAPTPEELELFSRLKRVEDLNLKSMKGNQVTDALGEGKTMYLDIEDAKKLEQGTMKGRELDPERVERAKKYTDNPIELGIQEGKVGIADGHHRLKALEELGETKVPISVDEDFVGSGMHRQLIEELGK